MESERIKLLHEMPIFGGVSDATLASLLDCAHIVSVRKGDFFFREGDQADAVYVLEKGRALVLKSWQGRAYQLNVLNAGACFGEMALIDMHPRSASVKAAESCRGIKITCSDLYRIYRQEPDQYLMILMNMGREISRRLREADKRLFLSAIAQESEAHVAGPHAI